MLWTRCMPSFWMAKLFHIFLKIITFEEKRMNAPLRVTWHDLHAHYDYSLSIQITIRKFCSALWHTSWPLVIISIILLCSIDRLMLLHYRLGRYSDQLFNEVGHKSNSNWPMELSNVAELFVQLNRIKIEASFHCDHCSILNIFFSAFSPPLQA